MTPTRAKLHSGLYQRLIWLLLLAVLWQLLAFMVRDARIFPGIDHIATKSFPGLAAFEGSQDNALVAVRILAWHSLITIGRILVGLVVGTIAGLLVGFGIHFLRPLRNVNLTLLTLIRAVPLFALIPLFLFWFGGGEFGVYAYISFGVFIIIATNTYEALCNIPPGFVLQSKLLGADRLQTFSTVHFFAIQPEMVAAFRNVVGYSWAFSLGAEYLSSANGLGYIVYQSYIYADTGKLLLLACLYGLFGIASYRALQYFLQGLVKWS
jgi:ABC-type nitrate/sulfonate/bicarbonate transport system permease component